MTDRTYTKQDMAEIEKDGYFEQHDLWRKEALENAATHRSCIEEKFPAAEGWYWCVGVDGELFLKEGE